MTPMIRRELSRVLDESRMARFYASRKDGRAPTERDLGRAEECRSRARDAYRFALRLVPRDADLDVLAEYEEMLRKRRSQDRTRWLIQNCDFVNDTKSAGLRLTTS